MREQVRRPAISWGGVRTSEKPMTRWGWKRWSWRDIFSPLSGGGQYLLKGFFQRSIFRGGMCKKKVRTGGMCTVLCLSDVSACNRTTHILFMLYPPFPVTCWIAPSCAKHSSHGSLTQEYLNHWVSLWLQYRHRRSHLPHFWWRSFSSGNAQQTGLIAKNSWFFSTSA